MPPSTFNTGVNKANAPAITNKAAAPPKAPCTNCSATVMIVKAPPIVMRPLAISPQVICPMFSIAFANINIAAPSIVNPTAVDMNLVASPVIFINIPSSANTTPTPINPCIIVPVSNSPNFLTADDNITSAVAKAIIPSPFNSPIPSRSVTFINRANSVNRTPTPIRPFVSVATSKPPSFLTEFARILIAVANSIKLPAPFIILPSFGISLTANINSPINTPTLIKPLDIPLQSKSDNFFIAVDRIRTAVDINIIADDTFIILLKPEPAIIFSNIAIDANNSVNRTAIAVKDVATLSESIIDKTTTDAVNTPIAVAIFNRTSAFSLDCKASNVPVNAPNISFIPPIIPPALSVILVKLFVNFLMPSRTVANTPVLNKSNPLLKLTLFNQSIIAFCAAPNPLPKADANPVNNGATFSTTFTIISKAPFTIFAIAVNGFNPRSNRFPTSSTPVVSAFLNDAKESNIDSIAFLTTSATGFITEPKVSNILLNTSVSFITSLIETRKSPNEPVIDRNPSPTGRIYEITDFNAFVKAKNASLPISIIANNPLNVRFKFSDAVSLSFKFSVKLLNLSDKTNSFSAVIGGKISRKASFIGVITEIKPCIALRIPSIIAVRPPKSFHDCNRSLRASADALITDSNA